MVKRREPKANAMNQAKPEPTPEQIEAFAAQAEGGSLSPAKEPELDPNANRDFKSMRFPFNEYEYRQLEIGSRLTGRSKLNFIRYAMLKLAKEMQEQEEQ